MTKTVLLGLTLVAVLAMAIAFPAVADAITGIKKTEIKANDDEIKKLRFQLEDKVPTTPFGDMHYLLQAVQLLQLLLMLDSLIVLDNKLLLLHKLLYK